MFGWQMPEEATLADMDIIPTPPISKRRAAMSKELLLEWGEKHPKAMEREVKLIRRYRRTVEFTVWRLVQEPELRAELRTLLDTLEQPMKQAVEHEPDKAPLGEVSNPGNSQYR